MTHVADEPESHGGSPPDRPVLLFVMGAYQQSLLHGSQIFSREAANAVRRVANFVTQYSKASYSKVTLTPLYP